MNRRVVFDTSVLVSAALRIGSLPHQALLQAFATCDLCSSPDTLAELDRVLARKKFDLYTARTVRLNFAALIRRHSHLFPVSASDITSVDPPCRDSNDNQFLALAQVSQSPVLVSSDDDLLILHPWHGTSIIKPADFLSRAHLP